MSVINWGIIGLGNIAYNFASAFEQVKNSKLISLASENNEKLEKFGKQFNIKKDFIFLGSAHNLQEVKVKKLQNVKEIFISPIFKHKGRTPLGIHRCRYFFEDRSYQKIALGGINKKNINLLLLTKFAGLAGINLFKKKGPE